MKGFQRVNWLGSRLCREALGMFFFIGNKEVHNPKPILSSAFGAGLLFWALGFVWMTALLSQEPTPWTASQSLQSSNLFGKWGEFLAIGLWNGLGLGVVPLSFFWFFVGFCLVRPEWRLSMAIRLIALGSLVPTFGLLGQSWDSPAPLGGLVGYWLKDHLFGNQIQLILTASLVHLLVVLCLLGLPLGMIRRVFTWQAQPSQPVPFSLAEPSAVPKGLPVIAQPQKPKPRSSPKTAIKVPGLPSWDLLEESVPLDMSKFEGRLRERADLLEKTLLDFGLKVKVVAINTGPVITQFEISLETGLRLNKVTRLADDISLNLRVPSVRIVAPIPGKNTVGVEVPNEFRAIVRMKEVLQAMGDQLAKFKIPLCLGKDNEGRPLVADLADMPHLLIAGSTGTGKSVCMNSIILSMLLTRTPDEVKMIMIDPKVVELGDYAKIPHLMHPVVHDMRKAEAILSWAVDKMEKRYELLYKARVRNIGGYNELGHAEILKRVGDMSESAKLDIPAKMPYIVIFIDEMADLMMMMKKEVESHIIRLAQKSRAAGIHLVVATQKPTVDVITGLIKSNLPSRICFKVVNKSDSRVVLDEMGADRLLGKGDMLYLPPGTSQLLRAQGTFASDLEIQSVVGALEGDQSFVKELVDLEVAPKEKSESSGKARAKDDLYHGAVLVVIREGRGSVSLLQRSLGIGYGRAARMIDWMAEDGVVGAYNGSNAREVVISQEAWEARKDAH